jgi:hypothetical protein
MAGVQIDGVNNKIDFDDDLDTSISANTDDTLVIEAGGNTMATITATTFTINDGTTITTADNTDTLSLVSTDADANSGPNLRFYRNSSSPANDDVTGVLQFEGRNNNSQDFISSEIKSVTSDVADGSEDGYLAFSVMNGGTLNLLLGITGPETVINDTSIDHDFRVESNGNTHMLFVDGGNDRVNIGSTDVAGTLVVSNGDSGQASLDSNANEFCIEDNASAGMTILTPNDSVGFILFGDSDNNNSGIISYDHSNNSMKFGTGGTTLHRFTSGGVFSANDSAPDAGIHGITLNQGAGDGTIMTFKSSDVAHGITAFAETDTFLDMLKNSDGGGGLLMRSFSETATAFRHVVVASGSSTAESTAATSYWSVDARKNADNTNVTGLAADDNLASFRHSDEAQFIIKGDGELFSNQSATVGTYDAYEDAQLVRAYDLNHMQGVINSKFDKFVQYNKDDLQKARLIGTDDDGNATPMVNITGMQRLHNGAIWQQYEKTERLANAMYELAKAAVGEEKANEILEQNEIKLLN